MKSINVKNIMEKGGLMIEALAMLGLIAVVTPTMYKKSAERTMEIEDINTATTIRTISNAAESYVSANYSTIIADMMTENQTSRIIAIDNLREYLPYGFDIGKSLVNYGTPKIGISRPNATSNSLTTFVLFPAKSDEEEGIGQERTTRIASLIGANGGYTREVEVEIDGTETPVQTARGIGGIWSLDHNNMETLFAGDGGYNMPNSNSIVTASSETIDISAAGEANNDKYLQRGLSVGEEGQTWRTAMAADLYMGGVPNDGIYDGTAYMHSIRNIARLVVGTDNTPEEGNRDRYGLYIYGNPSTERGSAFIGGNLIAGNQQFQVLENALGFLGTDSSNTNFEFELDAYKLKYGYVSADKYHFEVDKTGGMRVGYNNGRHNFSVSAYGDIDNYGNLNLAKGGGYKKVRIGTLDGGAYLLSGDVNGYDGNLNILMNDAGNPRYNGAYTLKYEGTEAYPDYKVKVGGDMQVFGTMGAYQLDANNVRASRLAVGSENVNDSKKWMEVDSAGVKIQAPNWGEPASTRLIVKKNGTDYEGSIDLRAYHYYDSRISGLALNKNGNAVLYNNTTMSDIDQKIELSKDTIDMKSGATKVSMDGRNSKFTIGDNNYNDVFTVWNLNNIDSAYILAEAPMDFYNYESGQGATTLRIKGNRLLSDEGIKIGIRENKIPYTDKGYMQKYGSGSDGAYTMVEFDTDYDFYNSDVRPGTIYVRPGVIELQSNDLAAYSLSADESTGTIIGRRFVDGSGEPVNVLYQPSSTIDRNPATAKTDYYSISNRYYKSGSSINYYDTYMVNPKYTSVMHDIKLTTRAGARLSDVLPDFINKGIYVVRNSYGDKYVEGDLIPTEKKNDEGNLISPPYKTTTKKVPEGETPGTWASPYAGEIPAPQCPPGYGRVVTLTPASFEVAQSGNISHYEGKWFVKRTSPVSGEENNKKLDGFEFATATDSAGNNVTFSPAVTYVIGSNSRNVKPFSVQQSNWLKTHVRPTRVEGSNHVKSWSAFLGFIYMESEYADLIDYLTKKRTVKIGTEEKSVQNPKMEYQEGGGILWNIFPVRRNSLDAYATVYCYFDRSNALATEINTGSNLVDVTGPLGAETAYKLGSDAYIQRLNDPTLRYNEAW